MPLRPAVAGTTKSQFLANLEVGYDFDMAPVGVATALGLPPSPFPRTMRIQSNAGAMDSWTWLVGGQSFTRAQLRAAALALP